MLTSYKLEDYRNQFYPTWAVNLLESFSLEKKHVPSAHPFCCLALYADTILEFYDVPKVIMSKDATKIHYMCMFFNQIADRHQYLGIQISKPHLMAYIEGQLDLRNIYLHPKIENTFYPVEIKKRYLTATRQIQPQELSEKMLPKANYHYDDSDITDGKEILIEFYKIEVPVQDRITFSILIACMKCHASSVRNTIWKIVLL